MPTDAYIQHLEDRLATVDAQLARARTAIDEGLSEDRSKALETWTHLKQRHEDLAGRIAAARKDGASDWSALHTSFREEADALSDTLESWLTRLT
ncbi:hypothetical protein P6F26_05300 [Roseibacterium sp. SDUM158017]|uniref:hypothetical protein n=1 Tax=Roseicyclus salinarum TaxID=3036773 RepID=UPI00241581CF|nr:hypothetical protein [Roseibacterium sp. SDUM158017]MDG4647851.1 hypothetical protein [Roseibacterium sp. SDUM158017]